jgi:hypothetical protein
MRQHALGCSPIPSTPFLAGDSLPGRRAYLALLVVVVVFVGCWTRYSYRGLCEEKWVLSDLLLSICADMRKP